jgi:membrane peptidoglycan carboxypeptidase
MAQPIPRHRPPRGFPDRLLHPAAGRFLPRLPGEWRARLDAPLGRSRLDAAADRAMGEFEALDGESRFGLVLIAGIFVFALAFLPVVMALNTSLAMVDRHYLAKAGEPLKLPPLPQRSTILARDGSVLQHVYFGENRVVVPISRYRESTIDAVLAIEDDRFFQHGPLDFSAIVRAAVTNMAAGGIVEGGSTISQQLVKETVTGDAPTLARKIREAADAIRLENTYSKEHILGMYLSEVYLGHGAYGMAAAAEYYFARQASELTVAQAALLAGMIRSPSYYDPLTRPKHALHRRNAVLARMLELGWITSARYDQASAAPIVLSAADRDVAQAAPNSYWTQYVVDSFLSNPAFGPTVKARIRALYQGGLKIYTTLEPSMERQAEQTLLNRMTGPGLPQAALVSIVPQTGAIRAMAVGNAPYGPNQYNLAVDPGGGRTAGSAFKVFTLAAALEAGISPNAVYSGYSPKTIPDCGGGETWTLHNAEPVGGGSYPLWLATADSVNVVFAQVIDQVGPERVAEVAHRMGITTDLAPVCPLTLGTSPVSPLDMTSGFATLANDGVHCQPYAIAHVVSSTGKTVYRQKPECSRAIPSWVAQQETAMLEGVVEFGTGTAADIGRPVAGKTGTGQDYQDAWFLGYVPRLATGVWVGYARAEIPMPYVAGYGTGYGGVLAAPIWHDFMLLATQGMPVEYFTSPSVGYGTTPPPPSPSPSPSPTTSPSGHGNGNGNGNGNGYGYGRRPPS